MLCIQYPMCESFDKLVKNKCDSIVVKDAFLIFKKYVKLQI